jgi:3-oxoacyl-[acyl-carrier protein] reductase
MGEARASGRVCLVTGGTRGIGRAVAEELLGRGDIVIATYRESVIAATAFRDETSDDRLHIVRADVASAGESRALIAYIDSEFGRLDVLVNNAGCTSDAAFASFDPCDYEHVIDTNLAGVIRLSLIAAPLLCHSGGAIINLSSLAGVVGSEGQVIYSATKGGVNGLTRLLARLLAGRGVQVNAIAPGFIATDMLKPLTLQTYEHILRSGAVTRLGDAAEVAAAVSFLSSGRCGYVSGQVLRVDGGYHR